MGARHALGMELYAQHRPAGQFQSFRHPTFRPGSDHSAGTGDVNSLMVGAVHMEQRAV